MHKSGQDKKGHYWRAWRREGDLGKLLDIFMKQKQTKPKYDKLLCIKN